MSQFISTLRYLYALQSRGIKLGLTNIRSLLSAVGDPHLAFPCIHIAGTNGKGSTAAMLAAMLTASGYRTGLYTSPHLVRFSERIRIDGKEIREEEIVRYAQLLRPEIEKTQATFFEATTAIAFQYFADKATDIAVIETGLGGRLDATNVVNPVLSIITSLGLDHTEILGPSIRHIAREKGGIIKPEVPCLVGAIDPDALKVLRKIADRRNTKLVLCADEVEVFFREHSPEGTVFDVKTPDGDYDNLLCSLPGNFQDHNILLASTAAHLLRSLGFPRLRAQSMRIGLAHIRTYSGLRGRFEILARRPLIIVDVAHNPDAMREFMKALGLLMVGKCVTIFGAMDNKDVAGMIAELSKMTRMAIAVSASTARAMEGAKIVRLFHDRGAQCINGRTVRGGIRVASHEVRQNEVLIVTGSHYVVGEFLQEYSVRT